MGTLYGGNGIRGIYWRIIGENNVNITLTDAEFHALPFRDDHEGDYVRGRFYRAKAYHRQVFLFNGTPQEPHWECYHVHLASEATPKEQGQEAQKDKKRDDDDDALILGMATASIISSTSTPVAPIDVPGTGGGGDYGGAGASADYSSGSDGGSSSSGGSDGGGSSGGGSD